MSPLGRKSCGKSGRLREEPKLIKRLLLGAESCVTDSKEEVFPALPSSFDLHCSRLSKSPYFFSWLVIPF